jgi:hypothetical protein
MSLGEHQGTLQDNPQNNLCPYNLLDKPTLLLATDRRDIQLDSR